MTEKLRLSQEEIDRQNAISAFHFACKKDTPQKFWAQCVSPLERQPIHDAICRALNLSLDDPAVSLAISHMRIGKVNDAHQIVVPYPIPLSRVQPDGTTMRHWLDVDQVLIWNPKTDKAKILGDKQAQLFGAIKRDYPETHHIYGHPRKFLQDWCSNLARMHTKISQSQGKKWEVSVTEHDVICGALAVGPIHEIRFPISKLPRSIQAIEIDAKKVNSQILKCANLPFVR